MILLWLSVDTGRYRSLILQHYQIHLSFRAGNTGSVRLRVSPADEKLPSWVKVREHGKPHIYTFLSLSVMEEHLPLCWALCSYGSRDWTAFLHIKDTSAQQVSCFRSDTILLTDVLLLRAVPCVCVSCDGINCFNEKSQELYFLLFWHFTNFIDISTLLKEALLIW